MQGKNVQSAGEYSGDLVSIYDPETKKMRHGIRQGLGVCRWPDGSMYDGNWFEGMRHGKGTFTDSQGNVYTGAWTNDQMNGLGEMTMSEDGRTLKGRWVEGKLQGEGTIRKKDGTQEKVRWREGVLVIEKSKILTKSRSWSGSMVFNAALVSAAVGCGAAAFLTMNKENRSGFLAGAVGLYAASVIENFCSTQFALLSNQVSQDEAYAVLDGYKEIKPQVQCSIKNYHIELKEIIEKKVIKADKDAVELRGKYKKKLEQV